MKNEKIIDSAELKGAKIEIVELTDLNGAQSSSSAHTLFFAKQANISLKFVRIKLNGGSTKIESGSLYYSKGNIQNTVPVGGFSGFVGKSVKKMLTKESAFNPEYKGYGEVVLEPTFAHYIIVELKNESIIVDKGLYYCSIGDIEVSAAMQKNFSSAIAGGEGVFQSRIAGTGFVVLSIPVPMDEIEVVQLSNETLSVDGNFALLRSEGISFSVKTSGGGVIGSVLGGEGLLQTFSGTGMVWLAPTAPVYRKLAIGGISEVIASQGCSDNKQ